MKNWWFLGKVPRQLVPKDDVEPNRLFKVESAWIACMLIMVDSFFLALIPGAPDSDPDFWVTLILTSALFLNIAPVWPWDCLPSTYCSTLVSDHSLHSELHSQLALWPVTSWPLSRWWLRSWPCYCCIRGTATNQWLVWRGLIKTHL